MLGMFLLAQIIVVVIALGAFLLYKVYTKKQEKGKVEEVPMARTNPPQRPATRPEKELDKV
jgi:hypothetical protein